MAEVKDYLGEIFWSEDDALPPDMELIHSAIPRITGMVWSPYYKDRKPELRIDGGDVEWEIYKDWVFCLSYRGNNAIYKRKK